MNPIYPKSFKELIKPIKKELIITVILAALGTLSLLVMPTAITVAIRYYIAGSVDMFVVWTVIAGLGLLLKQIMHTVSLGYAHTLEAKFRYNLRKDFADKLSRLPLGFFSETSSGAIRKFISEDTIKIHTIIAHAFSDATAGVTLPIACAIVMLSFEWRTALIILALTLLVLIIGILWMHFANKDADEINTDYECAQREMSHTAIEMVDGIKEIKNFGMTGSLFKRFDLALAKFSSASFKWLKTSSKAISFLMAIIQPTVMLFMSLIVCLFAIKMGWLAKEYTILFMLLSISLPSSLIGLMQLGNHVKQGKHASDNLLSLYAKKDQAYRQEPSEFVMGDIVFENVSFSYDDKNNVLSNINCKLQQGKRTAFVGASGSGKTTMTRLIARFWDVDNGSVNIGGIDVRDLSEVALFSNISIVFQDIALMNASIAENIAVAKPTATREEIINAAKSAFIHERIMRLPNAYDTVYGDENIALSGGERQRITIARAFLADTPIVLLDEATAQADAESEVAIQKALSNLSEDKTVVIIAHRLSSVVSADQIIVFDGGNIVQCGKHNDLLKTDGLYRDMWLAQNGQKGAV